MCPGNACVDWLGALLAAKEPVTVIAAIEDFAG